MLSSYECFVVSFVIYQKSPKNSLVIILPIKKLSKKVICIAFLKGFMSYF